MLLELVFGLKDLDRGITLQARKWGDTFCSKPMLGNNYATHIPLDEQHECSKYTFKAKTFSFENDMMGENEDEGT